MKDPPPFKPNNIFSFQLMLSKFELDGGLNPSFSPGKFELSISSIKVTTVALALLLGLLNSYSVLS